MRIKDYLYFHCIKFSVGARVKKKDNDDKTVYINESREAKQRYLVFFSVFSEN